ncbi:hypothetical protein PGB90_000875 [Kerria lacca]
MEDEFHSIKAGITVDIKRTDGRVHAALISGINRENRSVTVEWFEGNETKGKEIDLDSILALNTHLIPATNCNETISVPVGNKLARNSTKASIPVIANKGSYRSRIQSRPTNIVPTLNNHIVEATPTVPVTPSTPVATAPSSRITQAFMAPPPVSIKSVHEFNTQQTIITNSQINQNNKGGRRSNVVKEVEKLKKNREERRQRQAELKEEKEALMNLDPGNPNWEFLAMIREYQLNIDFRPLSENDIVEDHQITVCVRKRPLNKKEINRKEVDVISVPSKDQIVVHEPKNKVDLTKYLDNQHFRFDYAFNDHCSNELVYKYSAKPLVQTIFEGGMATCFAYGQTGSGKTHTMGGDFHGKTQDCKKGIYAMAAKDVFKLLRSPKYKSLNLAVSASFFEIYSGKVFDLLADKAKLRVLEDGKQQVQVVGLTETIVENVEDVFKIIQRGNTARTSGQTSANSNSSRSHAVFQIILHNPLANKVHGKFSLIDLAGNERGADTQSSNRQTRMEGAEINKSLLALKECIRALGRKGSHLPFRASKLTQVLRDSFIGDKSKTCMIAMISPGMSSCEHSLNTLRYADRVKELAATDPTSDSKGQSSPTTNSHSLHRNQNGSIVEDSDLAALRSLNEKELSAELYTFHEAVSQLQEIEDEVLDSHKAFIEMQDNWFQRSAEILKRTKEVDFDQDAYSKDLKDLIIEMSEMSAKLGLKLDSYREQLIAEEALSQMMKPSQRYN